MGFWSTITTSSINSAPVRPANTPGASVGLPRYLRSAGYNTSSISVDLPDPDTPVTHTRRLSGIRTSRVFRLCSAAPRSSSQRLWRAPATPPGPGRAPAPRAPCALGPRLGCRSDCPATAEVLAGERSAAQADLAGSAIEDDLAAAL